MQAIEQLIYSDSTLLKENNERSFNRYSDRVWYYRNPKSEDPNEIIEIHWQKILPNASPTLEILAKQFIKPSSQYYIGKSSITLTKDGALVMKPSALRRVELFFSPIVRWYSQCGYNGKLSELSSDQINSLICYYTLSNEDSKQVYKGMRSFATLHYFINLLKKLSVGFNSGVFIDGPSLPININYYLNDFAKTQLLKLYPEADYIKWREGGSFGGLPVYESMALLQNVIEFIRSDETKVIKAIARFLHLGFSLNYNSHLREGFLLKMSPNNKGGDLKKALDDKQKAMHIELFKEFGVNNVDELPDFVKTYKMEHMSGGGNGHYFEYISDITTAVLITLMSLTGVRARSEFDILKPSNFKKDKYGNLTFFSPILKTNHGLGAVRYIAGIAAESVNCIIELKEYIDPEGNENLFITAPQSIKNQSPSNRPNYADKHLASRVLAYCERRFNPHVEENMKILSFNAHSLRHAWAEFALRRFEGPSVPELIRQHFRHHFGSYMTDQYILGKIFEEDNRYVGKEYIRDIIGEAAEGLEHLYGPVGEFIHTKLSSFEFIGEEEIESIVECFDGLIEPHEYGFCVIRPETKTTAKCYDKDTKLPNTGEACWEKCGGCVNRLTKTSQREDIMRIAGSMNISMKNFKNSPATIPLANIYKSHLKTAIAAISEIDQRG